MLHRKNEQQSVKQQTLPSGR